METPVSSPTPIFLLRAAALRTESHHHPTLLKFTTEHLSGGLSTTFPSGWGGLMRLVDKWNLALIICVCVCVCLFFFKLWYPPSFLFLMDLLLFYLFFVCLLNHLKVVKNFTLKCFATNVFFTYLNILLQPGTILFPREHLTQVSGDIFHCHDVRRGDAAWI